MEKIPLILLPGLLNDSRLWADPVSGLSDVSDPVVGDLTGADTIRALAAGVLAATPAKSFALAGLSMGGYVALEILRRAPDRVAGLALLDTSARPDTPQATESRRELMRRAETDFASVPELLLPKMLHPSRLQGPGAELFVAMARATGKEAFLRQERAIMGRIDSRAWLGRIACPTLVLCGREDVLTTVDIHEELAAGIPGARLEIIPECGHLSPLDQPARVTAALRAWLASISAA